MLLTILVTVFTRVFPLEMQKRIVNQAINLKAVDLLLLYCGLHLAVVIINSALKYLISVLQTIIGQRAAAGMRKELYRHTLNLPLTFFRRTQPGRIRKKLKRSLNAVLADYVEFFDKQKYLYYSSLAKNLTFGFSNQESYS